MTATCSGRWGCGKSWGGLRMEHCTVCHQTFSGQTLGDAHSVGKDVMAKVCLTPDEMSAKGWRLVKDVWRGAAMPADVLAKRVSA